MPRFLETVDHHAALTTLGRVRSQHLGVPAWPPEISARHFALNGSITVHFKKIAQGIRDRGPPPGRRGVCHLNLVASPADDEDAHAALRHAIL
jgi:hypothetical protein